MNEGKPWLDVLLQAMSGAWKSVLAFLPELAGAVLLVVAGWLVARLLRAGTVRVARTLDRAMAVVSRRRGKPAPTVSGAEVLGGAVFWAVILVFLTAATQVLALETFGIWLNRLLAYLPTLLTGGLILVAGFFISTLSRDLVVATAPAGPAQSVLMGRAVQWAILLTALVLGADQIGVEITFLVILTGVVAAAVGGGLALAVSLGSVDLVRNLVGARHLQARLRIGDRVRMGGHEGRVLELTATGLVLDCPEGRVHLPARTFHEEAVTLLGSETDHG
ncbi:mechanosensitive ion channel family protein [Thiohalorhabdus methylotrophus]|uniref:Small-conductance mechanosensitive channel n=1 Tax=Thiohalorhabdus methylotrophus TaxID=3242694 RepID=A0ABV4TU96_9GAMM